MAYEYRPSFQDKLAEFLLGLAKLQETRQQRGLEQETTEDTRLDRSLRTMTAVGQLQSLEGDRQSKRAESAEKMRRVQEQADAAAQLFKVPRTQETVTDVPGQPLPPFGGEPPQEFQGTETPSTFLQRLIGRRRTPLHEALGRVTNPSALGEAGLAAAAKIFPEEPMPKPEEPYTLSPGQVRFRGTGRVAAVPAEPEKPTAFGASRAEAIAALTAEGASNPTEAQIGAKLRQLQEASQTRTAIAPEQYKLGQLGQGAVSGRSPLQEHIIQQKSAEREAGEQRVLDPEEAARLRVPYGTTVAGARGKHPLTTVGEGQKVALEGTGAILSKLETLADKVFIAKSPLERFMKAPKTAAGLVTQSDSDVVLFNTLKEGILANIVRTFGERGTLTEGDIGRARALLPKIWPIPDTREVALGKLKQLRDLIAEIEQRNTGITTSGTSPSSGPLTPAEQQRLDELRRKR